MIPRKVLPGESPPITDRTSKGRYRLEAANEVVVSKIVIYCGNRGTSDVPKNWA
jgi:putative transposon-encoded protein